VGSSYARRSLGFAVSALAVAALVATSTSQGAASVASPLVTADREATHATTLGAADLLDPTQLISRFRDPEARVAISPPAGWVQTPATALDRSADEDTVEVARFQARIVDAEAVVPEQRVEWRPATAEPLSGHSTPLGT